MMFVLVRHSTSLGINYTNTAKKSFQTTFRCEAKHMPRDRVMDGRIHPKQYQRC